jgi:1-deoxy-D-xylulose-5-phosphate synthase
MIVLVVSYGARLGDCVEAADNLKKYSVTVVDARWCKPLDEELLISLARKSHLVITVEEGSIKGGFGSAVLELFSKTCCVGAKVECVGVPDIFYEHAETQREQLQESKISVDSLVALVERECE